MSTEIIKRSGLALQVCSDEPDINKLTEEVNRLDLAGTTHGWQLEKKPVGPDGKPDPTKVKCADKKGRYHYVFTC